MLLCRAGAHAEGLLTEPSEALTRLLESLPVSLLSGEVHALLLLERAQRLPIATLQQIGERLLIGEVLLIREIGLRDTGTVAAEGTRTDSFAGQSAALLSILLRLSRHRLLNDVAHEGRHVLSDALLAELLRRDALRTGERVT